MRRRRSDPLLLPVFLAILGFLCSWSTVSGHSSIQARWSCYHHYLTGVRKSAVLPITGPHVSAVSNVQCIFENDGTVYTEIHSALENPYQLMSKKSVNFQVSDLIHLRDLVRRSQCTQTLTADWKNVPEHGKGGVTVVSLLNETTRVEYDGVERQDFLFDATLAGVRHLIPDDEEYDSNPTLTTTRLLCKHIPQPECVFRGKVEIDLEANLEWSYTFAFRTDTSNQTLLILRCGSMASVVRLESDYFLRTDGGQPIAVGYLSDATWHTAVVKHSEPDRHFLKIDDAPEIELARSISDDTATTITLTVSVNGDIQLIDPTDSNDDCLVSFGQHRRRHQETDSSRSMCKGCGCRMLTEKFDGLSRCPDDDDGAFSLRRDLDRLSFLHFEDAFEIDSNGAVAPTVSVSFKSDSDAGLVLFGYWEDSRAKGRLQVNYHTDSISAVYCHQREEEECTGCTIRDSRGFGRDEWIQTILWGGGDEMHLVVDSSICRLQSTNNLSLAEVYAIPQFAQGAAMFVGGTWHEKKRSGLYRNDAAQKYFENTREKAPVLRGCVKDVFVRGAKTNLASVLAIQQDAMLNEPSDSNAFAVKPGCSTCDPTCQNDVRCRSLGPLQSSPTICDCADIFQYNNSEGMCEKKRDPTPIVLSTAFLNQKQIIIDIDNTKAVLSKVWLKFALPKVINEPQTIAEFNSHRETLFNILVDTDGYVQVQLHGLDDERNAARQLNLEDDRVHLLQLLRRTPIGTRHTAKKYDLYIDGWHTVVSDIGKLVLNNISVNSAETQDEWSSVIIHDFGLAYEYDEHFAVSHSSNVIHQVDLHSELLPYQFRQPDLTKTGILDDSLWQRPQIVGDSETSPLESSPYGQVVDFTADIIEPEQLLSARWLLYSFILTILLCLLILICIVCWCVLRRRSLRAADSGSQRTIMRDSPDYAPVKMRPESFHGSILDDDSSIGTDDTDLQAYRDIPSHRVKIYRESMVSILVPSIDQPAEAAIVKRPTSSGSDQLAANVSPSSDNSAPLVQVNDD